MKILQKYDTISLSELKDRTDLLKRHETKYLIDKEKLGEVLETFKDFYDVLEIGQKRIFLYESCYFDTADKWSYHQHHQGKRLRTKVRTRAYLDSNDMTFCEIKLKKGVQTHKYRTDIDRNNHGLLDTQSLAFLAKKYAKRYQKVLDKELQPGLIVNYQRITLVHKYDKERVTIDLECSFREKESSFRLEHSVIVESKSEKTHAHSKYLLKELGIKTIGSCSKYCLGTIIIHGVKFNRFKHLMKKIGQIEKRQ